MSLDGREEPVASGSGDGDSPAVSEQVVLVLCGLIGSGKSTFAKALQQHFPDFIRCNQDELGSRQAVEHLAINSLRQGLSVCIDRTNIDAHQRRYWIEIAHMFPGTQIWALVFNTSKEVCAERLAGRKNHPTIKTYEQGLEVLDLFDWQYRKPTYAEGFDRILCLADGARGYAKEDIANLLDHIRDQVPPTPEDFPLPYGRGQAGYRGGYRKLDYRQSGHPPHGQYQPGRAYDSPHPPVYRHAREYSGRARAAPYHVEHRSPKNGSRTSDGKDGPDKSSPPENGRHESPYQTSRRSYESEAATSPPKGHSPTSLRSSASVQSPFSNPSSYSPRPSDSPEEVVYLEVE